MFTRLLGRLVVAAAALTSFVPALATPYHPAEEGQAFADFDDPGAPDSFMLYEAGQYHHPTDYFLGRVNWSNDRSDTLLFTLPSIPDGYRYEVGMLFRYFKDVRLSQTQGLNITFTAPGGPQPFYFSGPLGYGMGSSSYSEFTNLISGQLYSFQIETFGEASALAAPYYVDFNLTIVETVPEPSTALLLGFGVLLVPLAARRKSIRSIV